MNRRLIGLIVLAAFVGLPLAFTRAGDDEAKKKIDQIRKELDELTRKEKDLAKERDDLIQKEKDLAKKRADLQNAISEVQREAHRRAEELRVQKEIAQKKFDEADRKRHHAKIELRGKMVSSKTIHPSFPIQSWFVLTNETYWPLQMDNKKELNETAAKLAGQPVVVTGTISTLKKNTPLIYPYFPELDPGISPFPRQPRDPQIRSYPHGIQEPMQLPVIVDSIRLFDEK